MTRKHHSEEEVGHALAVLKANGNNLLKTSKATGVSRATLRAWAAGDLRHHPVQEVSRAQEAAETSIVQSLEGFAQKATTRADTGEFVDSLKGKDLLIATGIAIEKIQLLRGKPTSRQEQVKIALVDVSGLRSLSAQIARAPVAIPAVVEGQYKEEPEGP